MVSTAHPYIAYHAIAVRSAAAVVDLRGAPRERLAQKPPRAPAVSHEASGRPAQAEVGV